MSIGQHLAQGVAVFTTAGVWWWEEIGKGEWYELWALHGPYETAREAYQCARKEAQS